MIQETWQEVAERMAWARGSEQGYANGYSDAMEEMQQFVAEQIKKEAEYKAIVEKGERHSYVRDF